MAKISNITTYPTKASPVSADYVIGTDASSKATKTFTLQSIANLFSGSGSGTVTSVGLSAGTTGLIITSDTANPITGSGTFTLSGTLAAANGGTGLTTLTRGSVLIGDSSNSISSLAIGANTYVLTSNGTDASWQDSGASGVAGHTIIDMAAATTDTVGFVNSTFLMTTTVDSTFTASSIKFQYVNVPASVSNLTVGIYTYVEQGINSSTPNLLLGEGSVGTNPTTKRVSIDLTAKAGQSLLLTAGTNYVIAWKQVGGNAGSRILAGSSGTLTDVNLAAIIDGNPALPSTLVNSGEFANSFTATTRRPALTIY